MKNVFIVLNPVAGTMPADEVETNIRQHFEALEWSYEIYQTTGEENVIEVVRQSDPKVRDLIVAAGGDGTIAEVASALINQNIPLGILPVGTGNGLANDLRIPLKLEQALELLSGEHQVRQIDAMEVEGRCYLLNLSVGLTPAAIRQTSREEKRRLGKLAYFFAGFRALFGIQPVTFMLEVDGKQYTRNAYELLLMNGVTLGETGRFLDLDIVNHDGKLDLFIVKARTIGDYLKLLWNLAMRRSSQDPHLERLTVHDTLVIRTGQFLEVQADGDLIGHTPKTVRLIPSAVHMIIPVEEPPTIGEQIIAKLPTD